MKRKTYESFHANILIRKDQFEAVREIADKKSISISALVRMLLDGYLKDNFVPVEQASKIETIDEVYGVTGR